MVSTLPPFTAAASLYHTVAVYCIISTSLTQMASKRILCQKDSDCAYLEACCDGVCTQLGTETNCVQCDDPCSGDGVLCCPDLKLGGFDCESLNDPEHCGACNNKCTGPDAACCSQTCTNTDTNPVHCGGCDKPCSPGQQCSGGKCVCPAGTTDCSGNCRDLQTDRANCGTCGNVCLGGKLCIAGSCACPQGQTDCGGFCIPVGWNCCPNGNNCPPTQKCCATSATGCCPPGKVCCYEEPSGCCS
jgi:hypothetical protein